MGHDYLYPAKICMKFTLDASIATAADAEEFFATQALCLPDGGAARHIGDIAVAEGRLIASIDGEDAFGDFPPDPVIRLVESWLRKLPWIISGDTETVALRNSEHCFAFVPSGESVEVSFFTGSEAEIEDYVLEPINVRRDAFVQQSIALGERIVALINALEPSLMQSNEDCRDLHTSLTEAQKAWHDYQLHARR